MELAPIALSTYSRLEHLKKTVDALKKNTFASDSDLFVFSDAPRPGDETKVKRVRDFAHSIEGFNSVNVVERTVNSRVNNNRNGIKYLLDNFQKCIYLEEDIVTSQNFLEFINQGLLLFEDRKDIFAICGYTPPINLQHFYSKDIYLSPRFSAWGFGIWADRYDKIKMQVDDFNDFASNQEKVKQFSKGGEDLMRMLALEATGEIDALDVKIMYTQFLLNNYVVAPTISVTNNIGMDGSGVHCSDTERFDVNFGTEHKAIKFEKAIVPDHKVINSLYYFRSNYPQAMVSRCFVRVGRKMAGFLKFVKNAIKG